MRRGAPGSLGCARDDGRSGVVVKKIDGETIKVKENPPRWSGGWNNVVTEFFRAEAKNQPMS